LTCSAGAQIALKAYLLWEQRGKPSNADFSGDARSELQEELSRGITVAELERRLRAPAADKSQDAAKSQDVPPPQQQQQAAQPAPVKQAPPTDIGKSLGTTARNPLAMIKV
jgi:hypothetical protein